MAIDGNYDNPDRARRLEKEVYALRAENATLKSQLDLRGVEEAQNELTELHQDNHRLVHEVERLKARLERVEAAAREVTYHDRHNRTFATREATDRLRAVLDDETKGVG